MSSCRAEAIKALVTIFGLCCYQSVEPSGNWVLKLQGLSGASSRWCQRSVDGPASILRECPYGATGSKRQSQLTDVCLSFSGIVAMAYEMDQQQNQESALTIYWANLRSFPGNQLSSMNLGDSNRMPRYPLGLYGTAGKPL